MSIANSNRKPLAPLVAALLGLGALTLSGCEQEGPMEQAGEQVDDAIDEAQDAAEDARDEVQDAVENARESVENEN